MDLEPTSVLESIYSGDKTFLILVIYDVFCYCLGWKYVRDYNHEIVDAWWNAYKLFDEMHQWDVLSDKVSSI